MKQSDDKGIAVQGASRACDGCAKTGRWFWVRWCDGCVPASTVAERGAVLLASRDGAGVAHAEAEQVEAGKLVQAVHLAAGKPERNLEDLVVGFLEWLGHPRERMVLQERGADIAVRGGGANGRVLMVVEVKRSLEERAQRAGAIRQGFDYAGRLGAPLVVICDADRYEVFDRERGLTYERMRVGGFRLTAIDAEGARVLRLLGVSRAVPGPGRTQETHGEPQAAETRPEAGTPRLTQAEAGPGTARLTQEKSAAIPAPPELRLSAINYLTGERFYRRVEAPALSTPLCDVAPEGVRWLWEPLIPEGKLTVLCGDPGVGKSFLTMALAARVSAGLPMPSMSDVGCQVSDGNSGRGSAHPTSDIPHPTSPPEAADVVLLSAEDDAADTIRPRLLAMGGDPARVHVVGGGRGAMKTQGPARGGHGHEPFSIARDVPRLDRLLASLPRPRLVVIDPVSAFVGDSESYNNAQVRALLRPLSEMAAARGVAVVLVTHLRKGTGRAIHRSMGSLAFAAAARVVLSVTRDPRDGARRLLLPVKSNLGGDGAGLAFGVKEGRVEFERGVVRGTAEELLAVKPPRHAVRRAIPRGSTERPEVAEWRRRVGLLIRDAREASGLSQVVLGRRVRMRQNHVSRIELGEAQVSRAAIRRLARALGVEVGEVPGPGGDSGGAEGAASCGSTGV